MGAQTLDSHKHDDHLPLLVAVSGNVMIEPMHLIKGGIDHMDLPTLIVL